MTNSTNVNQILNKRVSDELYLVGGVRARSSMQRADKNRRRLLVEALVRVTYRMKAWAKVGERKK